jgi:hypothetical protein
MDGMKTSGEHNGLAMQINEIEVVSEITEIEVIAIGNSIRDLDIL